MATRLKLMLICCEHHCDAVAIAVDLLLASPLAGNNPKSDSVDMWCSGVVVPRLYGWL
jgi:hypothetical protein